MDKRQFIQQVVSLGLVICSALMIWKGLMFVTNSESPIVVVLRFCPFHYVIDPGALEGGILKHRIDDATRTTLHSTTAAPHKH